MKRPYTPSSVPGTTGYFDLTVKRYETGSISKYLHDREPGDTVLMNGPNSGGHWVDGMANKVGLVAGGTGITPMISIIRWILAKSLAVELFLGLCQQGRGRYHFPRGVGRECARARELPLLSCVGAAACWLVTRHGPHHEAILRGHLPPPGPDTVIFLCGPPPMADTFEATLKAIGHSEQAIILP